MTTPYLVKAHLASPLAGDPPRLDALLEWCLSLYHPKAEPGYKVDRKFEAPPQGEIPIPLPRRRLGPWLKACVSDPILSTPDSDGVEHVNKRIGVEKAGLVAPEHRRVIATGNSWTKSYRLPMRVRVVPCVAWFALAGDRRELLKVLRRHARAIGKKVSIGYGRVSGWTVEKIDADHSWYADAGRGPLLMATLPIGDWLPEGLIGARRDFCAVTCPYWHVSRYDEAVVPC